MASKGPELLCLVFEFSFHIFLRCLIQLQFVCAHFPVFSFWVSHFVTNGVQALFRPISAWVLSTLWTPARCVSFFSFIRGREFSLFPADTEFISYLPFWYFVLISSTAMNSLSWNEKKFTSHPKLLCIYFLMYFL